MHGLGNDFMVVDLINQTMNLTPKHIKELADRHRGVGFDQLLCLIPARDPKNDFGYRIFNADGSEAEHCGNGARCVARFAHDRGITRKSAMQVETLAGVLELILQEHRQVRVNMGRPIFEPEAIPFQAHQVALDYKLPIFDATITLSVVSMGNPHAVLLVDDIQEAPVERLGPIIEKHPSFPHGTNVGFMQILSPNRIALRVFERGAGETLACGTGACAAVVVARNLDLVKERVTVCLPGGELTVQWEGEQNPVWVTGPAMNVFRGELLLD